MRSSVDGSLAHAYEFLLRQSPKRTTELQLPANIAALVKAHWQTLHYEARRLGSLRSNISIAGSKELNELTEALGGLLKWAQNPISGICSLHGQIHPIARTVHKASPSTWRLGLGSPSTIGCRNLHNNSINWQVFTDSRVGI